MNIYVGFSKPRKFKIGAALISWWMCRPYSHAYVRFESSDPDVPSTIYQASHGMCHFRACDNFDEDNIRLKEYVIPVSKDVRKRTLIKCMRLAGEAYGYLELIQILISDIGNSMGIQIHFQDSPGYICSELVGTLCTEDLGIIFSKPNYLLKPVDIDQGLTNYECRMI